MPVYSPHTVTTSLSLTQTGTTIGVTSDSTYSTDNHTQSNFSHFLLEIEYPDDSVTRYASMAFYSPYTVFTTPAAFAPSQFSKTETVDQFGFYDISFYQVPLIDEVTNTEYGLGDCFIRNGIIYQVVANDGVDVTVDTTFTDVAKYSVIDIYDVPAKYKYEETVFLLLSDILICINKIIEAGACAIKEDDKDTLCSNPVYLAAIEASIAKKVFKYAETNPDIYSEGEIDEMINYYTNYCADNECCTTPVVQQYETGLSSCTSCEDEDEGDGVVTGQYLTGKRWKTSNTLIQVSGSANKRYFEDLVGVEEDDIISVTVGDVEYSFEIEITDWDSENGVMTFLNILPDETTTGGLPVWIRIQWNKTA